MSVQEAFKYPVADRALKKWSESNLELVSETNETLHYKFLYQGSTCNNGGTEFKAHLHIIIGKADSDRIIQKAWIDIPEDERENASAMCAAPSSSPERLEEFYEKLAQQALFIGRTLDEVILEETALNYAGCFCGQAMINQKWKMALSTVHYQVNNT
jgi:hypothetical protein